MTQIKHKQKPMVLLPEHPIAHKRHPFTPEGKIRMEQWLANSKTDAEFILRKEAISRIIVQHTVERVIDTPTFIVRDIERAVLAMIDKREQHETKTSIRSGSDERDTNRQTGIETKHQGTSA